MARIKTKSANPQIVSPYSPLEKLAQTAMRRMGETAVSTADGEVMLDFLSYANAIIDELHVHPYWPKGLSIPYYTHVSDARPIQDTIMSPNLLWRFAADQGSKKAPMWQAEGYRAMNTVLTTQKFGVGAEFEFQAVDVAGGGVK
jgi:hypothetical protein